MEKHLKSKGRFDYLPWAVVVKQLILLFPDATWRFLPCIRYPDDTVMVECSVTIQGVTKHYILPVYSNFGGRPKAIINPDAYAINTAYQRCLVKTVASFGLGLDIFTQDETDELYVDVEEKPVDMSIPNNKFAEYNDNGVMKKATPESASYWQYFAEEIITSCKNEDDLLELWNANKPKIDRCKKELPDTYKVLVKTAQETKAKFKEKANG